MRAGLGRPLSKHEAALWSLALFAATMPPAPHEFWMVPRVVAGPSRVALPVAAKPLSLAKTGLVDSGAVRPCGPRVAPSAPGGRLAATGDLRGLPATRPRNEFIAERAIDRVDSPREARRVADVHPATRGVQVL